MSKSAFFERMLNGTWKERDMDLIGMQFDDCNITQEGFEIVIGRLYGVWTVEKGWKGSRQKTGTTHSTLQTGSQQQHQQQQQQIQGTVVLGDDEGVSESLALSPTNVLTVLATAAYLGVEDLCDHCATYAIRILSTDRIIDYVRFSHYSNYYPWTDRIAEACFVFLCRHGFEDPKMKCLQVFEQLPAEWLSRVTGSHAFWVPSEWERYLFCRQVVHRRRQFIACRCLTEGSSGLGEGSKEKEESCFQKMFSTDIIYMHMTFEQLRAIMDDRDPTTGCRFTRSHIIHEALWQQVELRTLIDKAKPSNDALGLTTGQRRRTTAGLDSIETYYERIPEEDMSFMVNMYSAMEYGSKDLQMSSSRTLSSTTEITREGGMTLESSASSYWNIYVQKLPSTDKDMQLGVFLHRHSLPKKKDSPLVTGFLSTRIAHSRGEPQTAPLSHETAAYGELDDGLSDRDQTAVAAANSMDKMDGSKNLGSIEASFSYYVDKREKTRTWFKIYALSLEPTERDNDSDEKFQIACTGLTQDLRHACGHGVHQVNHKGKQVNSDYILRCPQASVPTIRQHPISTTAYTERVDSTLEEEDEQEVSSEDHEIGARVSTQEDITARCSCQAQEQNGRDHHHHVSPPSTIKFSIIMGHI
ncbi:hypothetical protein BGX28_010442 [Mortierella sp. GBA30]|nr:hypothetical protein BGX28_010442 [Mortierella sp. GBA30]